MGNRLLALLIILIIVFIFNLCIDKYIITLSEIIRDADSREILLSIRLPRVLTGLLVGASMGLSGAVMQNITRNPIASPYTLGISAGAGLGAALATFKTFALLSMLGVTISALFGALATSFFIFLFYMLNPTSARITLVLLGFAISALCGAGIAIAQYFATPDAVYQYVFWSLGNLRKTDWSDIQWLSFTAVTGYLILMKFNRDLDILANGEVRAKSLGINTIKLTVILMFVVSVLTSVSVSMVGIIGFVGLVAPHIARAFFGQRNLYVLPASAMIAAIILISADFMSHYFTNPVVFPIGAITALVGAPFFIWFIIKRDAV